MSLIALVTALSLSAFAASEEDLSAVSCDRLAEALVAYHEMSLEFDAMSIGFGGTSDPRVAEFGRRIEPAVTLVNARGLTARGATESESALNRSSGTEMVAEFERRCLP